MTGVWQDRALCAQVDPEIFAPDKYIPANTADAKAICHRCPALTDCLEDALTEEGSQPHEMRASVRGGTTPRERHAIAKRRQQQNLKAAA